MIKFGRGLPVLAACITALTMLMGAAQAQRDYSNLDDQPGLVPNEAEEQLPPQFQRQMVLYRTSEPPGTIIVHTNERFLYLVQPGGRAMRYGIGVGREGFQWQGLLQITRKQEWPDWTPPAEMIARQPYLPRFMAGGPGNPMGARALSRHHGLPHPRHQPAAHDRQRRVVGLLPSRQQRRGGPLRACAGRDQGRGATAA